VTDPDAADAALAAGRDGAAFARLYARHSARVHSLARRLLGPGEADDATQDAFIRCWDRLHTFRGDSAFGTWLHRLAVNVILARRSTLATRRGRYVEKNEAWDADHEPAPRPHRPELVMDFEAALERLPGGQREVLVLHDVEGYKHEEIATMLGISEGTSKSQLHRGRMAMRKYLT
jgi:RNA polymerase sigma-70 factor (ECF subfamily)